MNIAVFGVGRSAFGDCILQIPFLLALRNEYPESKISFFSKHKISKVLLENDYIDNLIDLKGMSFLKKLVAINSFDMVFNLREKSEGTHLISILSRSKTITVSNLHRKFGTKYDFYNLVAPHQKYTAIKHLDLINGFRGKNYTTDIISNSNRIKDEKDGTRSIAFIPCAGNSEKKWSINNYIEVAYGISKNIESKVDFYFIYGDNEKDIENKIPDSIDDNNVIKVFNSSVSDMISLSSHLDLVITNDCGPGHIFQMAKVPLILLLGRRYERSPFDYAKEWYLPNDKSIVVTPSEADSLTKISDISVNNVLGKGLYLLGRSANYQ